MSWALNLSMTSYEDGCLVIVLQQKAEQALVWYFWYESVCSIRGHSNGKFFGAWKNWIISTPESPHHKDFICLFCGLNKTRNCDEINVLLDEMHYMHFAHLNISSWPKKGPAHTAWHLSRKIVPSNDMQLRPNKEKYCGHIWIENSSNWNFINTESCYAVFMILKISS